MSELARTTSRVCTMSSILFAAFTGCSSPSGTAMGSSAGQEAGGQASHESEVGASSDPGLDSLATWESEGGQAGADSEVGEGESDDSDFETLRFDLGQLPDAIDLPELGCNKVDFLFVIDNSGSMADEQENLRNSFPGFITAIEGAIELDDYHVMVVDTDANSSVTVPCRSAGDCWDGVCTCGGVDCCDCMCRRKGTISCNGDLCDGAEAQESCDIQLGAGRDLDSTTHLGCDFPGGLRYLQRDDAMLFERFACAASLGIYGDGEERPMNAMESAISPMMTTAGGCNAGFLRDDAILVVTVITDEEEWGSQGEPETWKQTLVAAKGGNEDAVVVLGLIGDRDLQNPICEEHNGGTTGAQASPRLRSFVHSFKFGTTASVCLPDYGPFFADAVAVIDQACDIFDPPN